MSSDIHSRIMEKLDKIDERQDVMAMNVAQNTANLAEHMRRTDAIEQYVQKEIPPLKRLKQRAEGAAWALSMVAGALVAAKSLGLF